MIHHTRRRKAVLFSVLALCIAAFFFTKPIREGSPQPASERFLAQLRKRAARQPDNPKAHYQLGLAYNRAGYFLEAEEELQRAVQLGMDTASVHYELGLCRYGLGFLRDAIRYFSRAIKQEPQNVEYYLALTDVYQDLGRNDLARKTLDFAKQALCVAQDGQKRVKASSEGDRQQRAKALAELAGAYGRIGEVKTALSLAQECLKLAPRHPSSHFLLGRCYLESGRIEEAIVHLRRAAKGSPRSAQVRYQLAVALSKESSSQHKLEAIEHLKKALALDRNLARAYYLLGQLLMERKQWRQAAQAFAESERLGYESLRSLILSAEMYKKAGENGDRFSKFEAVYRRGRYYEALGNLASALKEYQKLTQWSPCCASGYAHMGKVYDKMGKHEEYLRCMKKAIEFDPKSFDLHLLLADAYFKAGMARQQRQVLEKAASLDPQKADYAYYELATLTYNQGKYDEAERYLQECVQLYPRGEQYWLLLGRVYFDRMNTGGRLKKAIYCFEKATSLTPDNAEAFYRLGVAYTKAGRWEDAAAAFRRVINLEPGRGEVYLSLGQVYRRLGKEEQARQMFAMNRYYEDWQARGQLLRTRAKANPTNIATQKALADFYLQGGDYLKALQTFEHIVSLRPDDLYAHEKLAVLYQLLARPSERRQEERIIARLRRQQKR